MHSTLLILIPGFAKDENDSTCIPFAQLFIKSLNRNYPELEVIIITLDYPAVLKEYAWFGNKVIPLNGSKYRLRPLLWVKLYSLLKQLNGRKKTLGILNFWCADNALIAHYFSKWNNIKHFSWLQGQDARKGNRILSFFKPRKENLVTLSDFLSTEFNRNYSIKPCHIIYPGLDKAMFSSTGFPKDIDIIGVGSLIQLKQYHVFIEAVEVIKKIHPGVKAMIVGNGPEAASLKEMIVERKLNSNIQLAGELPHEDVLQLMYRSKILLHPSSYEGYGMVCMEALAACCHIVSFVAPENKPVTHWNIVNTKEEMISRCIEILEYPDDEFFQVIHRNIDDCVNNILKLYDYRSRAHSVRELVAE